MKYQQAQDATADASSTHAEPPELAEQGGDLVMIMAESLHRRNDTHGSWPSKEFIKELGYDVELLYRDLKKDTAVNTRRVDASDSDISGTCTPGPDGKQYILVNFVPHDSENPRNWSNLYKWYCTMVAALTFSVVAFSSSIITVDISDVAQEFGVSDLVGLLTFSVFVLGFGSGMTYRRFKCMAIADLIQDRWSSRLYQRCMDDDGFMQLLFSLPLHY